MPDPYGRLKALAEADPEGFQKLVKQISKKTVTPHAAQRPIVDSKARFKVVNCGRRFGKTVIAAKILVAKSRQSEKMLWWVAPTYKIVKRGYAEILRQLPDGVLAKDAPPDTNFDAGRSVILHFKNGTKMEFYSAERPEGMLGAGVDFVVMDEAALMSQRIWNQIISPTLMDYEGGALMISTPRGHNWFYRCYQMGQDPQENLWASWTFTTQDNPTLPEGEADRMAASMPRMEADQEIYAKFLAAGSSVFHIPDNAIQEARILTNGLIDGFPPRGFVVLGIDLARTNDYTVLYGARMKDRRNVYFERMQAITWPEQKRRIRRAVATLNRAGAENVMMLVDSTGVGDPVVEDLEYEGYDVIGMNFTTHKTNMVRLLAKDLEESQAFILRDGQMDEFRDYGMALSPAGRMTYSAPEGDHDDVVAAKMLSHWGIINEGWGEASMIITPEEPTDDQSEHTDEEDFSDLLDLDFEDEGAALEAIGLRDPHKRPTTNELLSNPDLWV
jgi:phage FluMu gp28-like protein